MSRVKICDVTLRDGMQIVNRRAAIPLGPRLELLRRLVAARLPYIEVGSFVSGKIVPAMRDTAELLAAMPAAGAEIAVLVPNLRYYGLLRAGDHRKVHTVALFVSASERYSLANTNMSKAEAFAAAAEVASAARGDGFRLRGYLSCSFRELEGVDGEMDADVVRADCQRLLAMGCDQVMLSDTDGRATPRDLQRVLGRVRDVLGLDRVGVHLHDRYGQGLANALVAYQEGIRVFDSSVGGVGGTSAVENSVGNIATEELVSLFHGLGVDTGVDLEAVIEAGLLLVGMTEMAGEPVPPSKLLADRLARLRKAALSAASRAPVETPVAAAVEEKEAPALEPEHVGGAAFGYVFAMLLVPLTGFVISLVLTFVFRPERHLVEFLAFTGSVAAFVVAAFAAALIARYVPPRRIALAHLPSEAQKLFDDLLRGLARKI